MVAIVRHRDVSEKLTMQPRPQPSKNNKNEDDGGRGRREKRMGKMEMEKELKWRKLEALENSWGNETNSGSQGNE